MKSDCQVVKAMYFFSYMDYYPLANTKLIKKIFKSYEAKQPQIYKQKLII